MPSENQQENEEERSVLSVASPLDDFACIRLIAQLVSVLNYTHTRFSGNSSSAGFSRIIRTLSRGISLFIFVSWWNYKGRYANSEGKRRAFNTARRLHKKFEKIKKEKKTVKRKTIEE